MSGSRTDTAAEKLVGIIQDITFLPNPEHRKAKAAFWALYSEAPLADTDRISCALAVQMSGDPRVTRWWSLPGFQEWFANKDEFRQRMEYLANLALDTAEEMLLDKKVHPSARANMVKLVIEAANRMPNRFAKEQYTDERIGSMGRKELEAYVRRAIPGLALTEAVKPEGEE